MKTEVQQIRFNKALEVRTSSKNLSLLIQVESFGETRKAIYYPESGVRCSVDIRIPKPFELYHTVAYSLLCKMLDWDIAAPAVQFNLDFDDSGILVPYYNDVKTKPDYFFKSIKPNDFWIKLAVMDYLSGLIDRTYNDILFLPNGEIKVVDNGLSFVGGTDFVYQRSIIRSALTNTKIPRNILADICLINEQNLVELEKYLFNPRVALLGLMDRKKELLKNQVVL